MNDALNLNVFEPFQSLIQAVLERPCEKTEPGPWTTRGGPALGPILFRNAKRKHDDRKEWLGKRGATKWTWWSQKMEMRLAALYERWGRWGHAVPAALASTTMETHRAIQPNPGLKKRCPFQKSCFKVTCFQKVVAEHFRWEKGPLNSTFNSSYASHQLELLLYKVN